MRKLHIALAATVLAAGTVTALHAQNGDLSGPGTANAAAITAGTYTADAGHSLIGWKVNHFGFSDYFGLFGSVSGTLVLDPANIGAAKVDVTIPVSKVVTANPGLTAHLLAAGKDGGAPDFFGAAPADAKFVSTAVSKTSATEATITGNLTLNGITKPVTVKAKFTGAGKHPFNMKETVGFSGKARIKRSDFGIAYGLPVVTDAVDLDITVAFEK